MLLNVQTFTWMGLEGIGWDQKSLNALLLRVLLCGVDNPDFKTRKVLKTVESFNQPKLQYTNTQFVHECNVDAYETDNTNVIVTSMC